MGDGPGGQASPHERLAQVQRELLRQSCYWYEFFTVAVVHSLIAVEIVLRDRIPGAGKKPLHQTIKQGAETRVLTARQAEYLDHGRRIRNGTAHGQTTHAAMPRAMAVPMVALRRTHRMIMAR